MSYVTTDELRAALGSDLLRMLADEDGDGLGDEDIIGAAIEDAAREMDAALAPRHVTPVDPAPLILARMNLDLAIYYLFLRRREAITPEYGDRARQIRNQLADFGEGRTELVGATTRLDRMKSDSTTLDQAKQFDRETLEPY